MAPYLDYTATIFNMKVNFSKYNWQLSSQEDESGGGLALQEAKPELKQKEVQECQLDPWSGGRA